MALMLIPYVLEIVPKASQTSKAQLRDNQKNTDAGNRQQRELPTKSCLGRSVGRHSRLGTT